MTLDPDRFIHTRGPHEGQYGDGEHVCVPECTEDTSHMMEHGRWVDPRPRYRVLTAPWYDHDGAHDGDACVAGFTLEIFVVNPNQPPPLGWWRPLGATQTDTGGRLDVDEVRNVVIDYVRTLAYPAVSGVTPDRIEVYRRINAAQRRGEDN